MDHECDRQTAYVGLVEPSVESIQNAKFDTQADAAKVAYLSTGFDLSLTHSFGVNP